MADMLEELRGIPDGGQADADLLARFGDPMSGPAAALVGSDRLWLVTGGQVDLFTTSESGSERWTFLARVGPGTLLPGCAPGPDQILIGRPERPAAIHRLYVDRLPSGLSRTGVLDQAPTRPGSAGELAALARGVEAGVQALLTAVTERPRGAAPAVPLLRPGHRELADGEEAVAEGVVWVTVLRGSVHSALGRSGASEAVVLGAGDVLRASTDAAVYLRSTGELLADGSLHQYLTECEKRVRYLLDRRITEDVGRDEQRLLAGRAASDAALSDAVRALRSGLDKSGDAAQAGAHTVADQDEMWLAAVDRIADAAGITVTRPAGGSDPSVDMVERIALASRFRVRQVRLTDRWWRDDAGPLLATVSTNGVPVALLWQRGGYRVVEPLTGRSWRVTREIAKELAPTALMCYRPLEASDTRLRGLIRFGLRGSRRDLLRMLAGGGGAVLLGLLLPVVTGRVLGEFVPEGERGAVAQACLAAALAGVVATVFGTVESIAVLRTEGRFEAGLQAAVWDRLLRAPAAFFARQSTGELAGAALGVSRIRQAVSGAGVTVVHSLLLAAGNLALQFACAPPLAWFSLALSVVGGAVFALLGVRQTRWQRRQLEVDDKLTGRVFQTLQGLPKLRVAAAENFAYAGWAHDFSNSRSLTRRVLAAQNAVTVLGAVYVPLSTTLLYLLVARGVAGRLSPADFLTFAAAFAVQLGAVSQLIGAISSLGTVLPLFERLTAILEEPSEVPEDGEEGLLPGRLSGEIALDRVDFRYGESGPTVLTDVSLRIAPGEFVAIVGPSGCGKSTLLRLLIGFERPTSGRVLYDGRDLATLDPGAVRRQCGVVLQHARPLRGTILDTIRGARHYSLAQVRDAVDLAGLSEDIAAMPMGLHTVLTDGGSSLSGGQRQRLMIAQALAGRPRILFLDEATSALDNETQRVVTESTNRLHATRVVVAHRLSTVRDADRVIVLDQGRIVQCGTPEELMADEAGLYHRLARRQLT